MSHKFYIKKFLSYSNSISNRLFSMSRYPSAYGHTPSYKSASLGSSSSGYPSALGSSVTDSGSGLGRDMDREMAAIKRDMDRDFGVTVSEEAHDSIWSLPLNSIIECC